MPAEPIGLCWNQRFGYWCSSTEATNYNKNSVPTLFWLIHNLLSTLSTCRGQQNTSAAPSWHHATERKQETPWNAPGGTWRPPLLSFWDVSCSPQLWDDVLEQTPSCFWVFRLVLQQVIFYKHIYECDFLIGQLVTPAGACSGDSTCGASSLQTLIADFRSAIKSR